MSDAHTALTQVYKHAWETMRVCYLEKVDENAALQKKIAELEQRIVQIVELMAESELGSSSE